MEVFLLAQLVEHWLSVRCRWLEPKIRTLHFLEIKYALRLHNRHYWFTCLLLKPMAIIGINTFFYDITVITTLVIMLGLGDHVNVDCHTKFQSSNIQWTDYMLYTNHIISWLHICLPNEYMLCKLTFRTIPRENKFWKPDAEELSFFVFASKMTQ